MPRKSSIKDSGDEYINGVIRDNLKGIRNALQLSQQAVAESVGIKRETYANYESRVAPPLHLLYKLAKIYNVSIDVFYSTEAIGNLQNQLSCSNNDDMYGDCSFLSLSEYEKILVLKIRQLDNADKTKIEQEIQNYLNEKKD